MPTSWSGRRSYNRRSWCAAAPSAATAPAPSAAPRLVAQPAGDADPAAAAAAGAAPGTRTGPVSWILHPARSQRRQRGRRLRAGESWRHAGRQPEAADQAEARRQPEGVLDSLYIIIADLFSC